VAVLGPEDGVQFRPAFHALWQHEFDDDYATADESLIAGGGEFDVRGVALGRDTARVGGGVTVAFSKAVKAFVNLDSYLNSRLLSADVSAGLSLSW